ncbi:MAG: PAS domain-containing protein [Actinobacteria bacterium]|nr:PAS domain-containing protein [Actinomycetota bacterium]
MRVSGSGQNRRAVFDQRDAEFEQLRKERDELLAREKAARAEAETAQRRLSELSSMSRAFASSMRGVSVERQRASRRLAVQYAVGRVLAKADGLEDAAPEILKVVGEGFGWDLGILWTVDESEGVLRCYESWRAPGRPLSGEAASEDGFETASRRTSLPLGAGLPGRAWERCEALWIEDVLEDEGFLRKEAAAEEGLRKAFAFPIRDGGRPLGVVEFFGREVAPPDQDLLRTTVLIGSQIGQFLQRRQAEEESKRLFLRERAARAEADASRREVTDILESINDAFFALDRERRFTYVNRRAEQFWGKPHEELLGCNIWEVFSQAVGSENYRQIERALEEGASTNFEAVSPVLDTWISVRVYPRQSGVSVFFQDINERKLAEDSLRRVSAELEQQLRTFDAVMSSVQDFVYIFDLSGRFTYVNESLLDLWQKTLDEAIGKNFHELDYPQDLAASLQRQIQEVITTCQPLKDETPYTSAFGTGQYEYIFVPLFDSDGTVEAVAGVTRDVTEHKRAEKALKESEERLRTVVDNAPVVLFALNPEGVFTLFTGRGLEALGLKPDEVVGQSVFEMYADHPPMLEDVRRALAGETFTAITDVGSLTFETGYAPLRDGSGEIVGVIGVATNVTERKKAEKERDRFLAREWRARAEAEERKRISRELHDRVAHSMAVVHQSLELHSAIKERDPEEASRKLALARETTKIALESTRNLSMTLRNEVEDGLAPALSHLLSTAVPPDVRTEISVEGDESLVPQGMRDQLFLILREGVRNAVSHAGAKRITAYAQITPEKVFGSVEDDGRSFDPQEVRAGGGLEFPLSWRG